MIEVISLQAYLQILVDFLMFHKDMHRRQTCLEALGLTRNLNYEKFGFTNPNPDHRFIEIELLKSDNIQLLREEIIRLEKIIKTLPSITEIPNYKMRIFLEERK